MFKKPEEKNLRECVSVLLYGCDVWKEFDKFSNPSVCMQSLREIVWASEKPLLSFLFTNILRSSSKIPAKWNLLCRFSFCNHLSWTVYSSLLFAWTSYFSVALNKVLNILEWMLQFVSKCKLRHLLSSLILYSNFHFQINTIFLARHMQINSQKELNDAIWCCIVYELKKNYLNLRLSIQCCDCMFDISWTRKLLENWKYLLLHPMVWCWIIQL